MANQYQRIVQRHTQAIGSHPIRKKKIEDLYRHLHQKYVELDATAHTRKAWLIMLVGGISAYVAASFYQFYRMAYQLDQTNARLERRVIERTRDLEKPTEQLDVARKLAVSATEAKSQFLANMSHEIRTPMTAIPGYVEFLETEGNLDLAPQSRLRAIHTIRRNREHLLAIINDIHPQLRRGRARPSHFGYPHQTSQRRVECHLRTRRREPLCPHYPCWAVSRSTSHQRRRGSSPAPPASSENRHRPSGDRHAVRPEDTPIACRKAIVLASRTGAGVA